MKTESFSTMPIVPEEYEATHADKVDWSDLNSEMSEQERKFVNGLIRYYQPQSLLEVGVSQGGGSVNLLNAINDQAEASLTSIDRMEFYYGDGVTPVGNDVVKTYPDLPTGKWNLITGKDPSEVMETLGKTYDFAVIDTAHLHPIESLNFLCVLPYLKDGAIVILHDISLFYHGEVNGNYNGRSLATRILLSTVTGEKIFPQRKTITYISSNELVHNIVALQINEDTRKYIGNVFQSLFIPWETYPGDGIKSIKNLLTKHYPQALMEDFLQATQQNAAWVLSERRTFSLERLASAIRALQGKQVVFYGAGQNMRSILDICEAKDITIECPIWDANARQIGEIYGHPVIEPNFGKQVPKGSTAIITISSKLISSGVQKLLERSGWTVINGIDELFGYDNLSSKNPLEFTKEDKEIVQYVKNS
jgi:predicted O-methyltransferase YrrM